MCTHTQIILFKEILFFSEPETWYRPSLSFVTTNEVAVSTVTSVALLTKAGSLRTTPNRLPALAGRLCLRLS